MFLLKSRGIEDVKRVLIFLSMFQKDWTSVKGEKRGK